MAEGRRCASRHYHKVDQRLTATVPARCDVRASVQSSTTSHERGQMSSYTTTNRDTGEVATLYTLAPAGWAAVCDTGAGSGDSPLAALTEAVDNGMPFSTALCLANILGDWTPS